MATQKMSAATRRRLLSRERFLNRALDEPWLDLDDRSDEDICAELLEVEQQLGHTSQWPHTGSALTTTVYGVRAVMTCGAVHEVMFARRDAAEWYASTFRPLLLGFDSVSVVEHRIIG